MISCYTIYKQVSRNTYLALELELRVKYRISNMPVPEDNISESQDYSNEDSKGFYD